MNVPTLYQFENQPVRIIQDKHGEPWFVAVDVCTALALSNPSDAIKRLDADEKMTLDTTEGHSGQRGGAQSLNLVSEAGLYSLILTSRKPEAKRFKRWLTHEVLPAIRKTGRYSVSDPVAILPPATRDTVGALLLIGEAVAKVPGVKAGIAMAATLTCIQENTGLSVETMRRTLPAANDPVPAMNPTQLGKAMGGLSAREVNQRLKSMGLQYRNDRDEWALTDAGQACAEALPYSRNGHSGYQILWHTEVIEQIREVA